MDLKIFTPSNQFKLSNIATIRLKKNKKQKFEIICYKNKILFWRNKLETNIDNVIQTHSVFKNVSMGQVAQTKDLMKAFGTIDKTKICLEILEKGKLQYSSKERAVQLEILTREVATILADKCVDCKRNRQFSTPLILKALKEAHFSPNVNKSAKKMALEMIPNLKDIYPIKRAQMKVKVSIPGKEEEVKKIRDEILKLGPMKIEDELFDLRDLIVVFLIKKARVYCEIKEFCKSHKGARLKLLNFKEITEGKYPFEREE